MEDKSNTESRLAVATEKSWEKRLIALRFDVLDWFTANVFLVDVCEPRIECAEFLH